MTKEEYNEIVDYLYEIKHNRDYYSRAKIIEMIEEYLKRYVYD